MKVEVIYALPDSADSTMLELEEGATAHEALERSGLLEKYPEISRLKLSIGVYGCLIPHERVLRDGDRLEVYRPLQADPKEARRRRSKKGVS